MEIPLLLPQIVVFIRECAPVVQEVIQEVWEYYPFLDVDFEDEDFNNIPSVDTKKKLVFGRLKRKAKEVEVDLRMHANP